MRRATCVALTGLWALGILELLGTSCDGGAGAAASVDASDESATSADASGPVDVDTPPAPDASVVHCTLDDGTDPVALCVQKRVLLALHAHAFDREGGVARGWSPSTGLPESDDGGDGRSLWLDDVGYAAAVSSYQTSAAAYGDTELGPILDADLTALATLLETALTSPPTGYSGEPYARLRGAAGGLCVINQVAGCNDLESIADSYGRMEYSYFASLPGGPGDAGLGGDAATGTDGIFGDALDAGARAYLTADAVTAAYAMLDLAARHPADPQQAAWQIAARSTLDHLYARARESSTGLYYTALVTSDDPEHDALDLRIEDPSLLLSDTTATVALALTRARDLVRLNPSSLGRVQDFPFDARIADALASLQAPSLYDGPANDGGARATGFMDGYAVSSGITTTKSPRPNAFILAALVRQFRLVGTPWATEIGPLSRTLTETASPNQGFLSVVPDQVALLGSCTRDFQPLLPDAGPNADVYLTAANVAFIEGLNLLLPPQP